MSAPTSSSVTPSSSLGAFVADHDETGIDIDSYKAVFRGHPAGVAVVALRDDTPGGTGRLVGFTATSVISVSAAPPLIAFSIASSSSSWDALSRAATVTVSFLADDQDDVSARFATSGVDRFAAGGWSALPTGEPVVDGALAWVRARVVQRTAVGASHLVSLRALEHGLRAASDTVAGPLVYHDRTYHRIGDHTAI